MYVQPQPLTSGIIRSLPVLITAAQNRIVSRENKDERKNQTLKLEAHVQNQQLTLLVPAHLGANRSFALNYTPMKKTCLMMKQSLRARNAPSTNKVGLTTTRALQWNKSKFFLTRRPPDLSPNVGNRKLLFQHNTNEVYFTLPKGIMANDQTCSVVSVVLLVVRPPVVPTISSPVRMTRPVPPAAPVPSSPVVIVVSVVATRGPTVPPPT